MADKVKEFFVNNPKYNEDKDFEAYSSMTLAINLLFIVNALLHSVYLVGFSLVGIQELAIVEIIDVTLYAAGVIFIKYVKWSWIPCLAYTILETFSHQIMCLLLFGKETGFEFLFIPIIIIAMFIDANNRVLASCVFCFCIFFNSYERLYSRIYYYTYP